MLTDEKIIEIRKQVRTVDPRTPFGDTLAFAHAVLDEYRKQLLEAFTKDTEAPIPVKNDDGSLRQFTVRVAGSLYRCTCGCNVFHKPDNKKPERYQCNGCGDMFE